MSDSKSEGKQDMHFVHNISPARGTRQYVGAVRKPKLAELQREVDAMEGQMAEVMAEMTPDAIKSMVHEALEPLRQKVGMVEKRQTKPMMNGRRDAGENEFDGYDLNAIGNADFDSGYEPNRHARDAVREHDERSRNLGNADHGEFADMDLNAAMEEGNG